MFKKLITAVQLFSLNRKATAGARRIMKMVAKDTSRLGTPDLFTEDGLYCVALSRTGGVVFGLDPMKAISLEAMGRLQAYDGERKLPDAAVVRYTSWKSSNIAPISRLLNSRDIFPRQA